MIHLVRKVQVSCVAILLMGALSTPRVVLSQTGKYQGQAEWDKTVELAKKEGKVVVSIPSSAELRKEMERVFQQRFGIQTELVAGRGSAVVRKLVEESKAGVRYMDIHFGGSESIVTGLLPEGILEPLEAWMVLPEVRDSKQWWGGHIWTDTGKRFVYSSLAYQTGSLWGNGDLMKPEEIRGFDDLLEPKWKGKIGFLDPRTPGSGASMWSYMREIRGEDYLKKLVGQKMLVSRDQRLLAENLAKGKIALTVGLTYYSFAPFLKAGLPILPLPTPKEGLYVSGGSGNVIVVKNPPHPNAARVFLNWFLSKEGQEVLTKGIGQGTRRLDVETKWLQEFGVIAAKDRISLEDYFRLENQSEDKVHKVREPGAALARKLLD